MHYNGKKFIFSTIGARSTGYSHARLDTDFTPFTNINSKWVVDLNVKHQTIELLENTIGENLDGLGFGNNFLNITQKAQSMKERIDKLDFIKIKIFCSVKDTIKRIKR